jgi:hypothetical protein
MSLSCGRTRLCHKLRSRIEMYEVSKDVNSEAINDESTFYTLP